jgi:hypothetical protein
MEAICSSETLVDFQWTTLRYNPEDSTLYMDVFLCSCKGRDVETAGLSSRAVTTFSVCKDSEILHDRSGQEQSLPNSWKHVVNLNNNSKLKT